MPDWLGVVDTARAPVSLGFAAGGAWLVIDRRALARRLVSPDGPAVFDLVYGSLVLATLAAITLVLGVSPAIALLGGIAALLVYPATRRASARVLEGLVVGSMRREAAIRAIEDERGRLAREIHDAPLQGLAAVIRRLDDRPDAIEEASALREVAGQLRDVATALHPPVLEDLGLVAALIDLADTLAASHPDLSIVVDIDDLTSTDSRVPVSVEMAAYRIAQEAAANALQHSRAGTLRVRGSASPDAIDLSLVDDGIGIDRTAAHLARRAGHFGLDAMRERAEAVQGQLDVSSGSGGTIVRFTWESHP
jgi:two-component system NarL family sensor kinase